MGGLTGSRREGYDYHPLTILGHMQAIPTVEGRCYDRTLNSINSINSTPFLMVLGTPAAHGPFTPAPQYMNEFNDEKAPRTPG